jgi:hypothetical protein
MLKVMTKSAGNHWTGIHIRQQEIAGSPYNDCSLDLNIELY